MRDQVMYKRIGQRELVEEVFLTKHGADDIHSASLALTNVAANNFVQVPAGTVIGKWKVDDLHYPIAFDSAQAAVSAANDITVDDVLQFLVGDFVEIEGVGFRKITAVDYDNDTITVDGAAITLSAGDELEVDRTRSVDTVSTTAAAPGTATTAIAVDNADRFEVGDIVDVGAGSNILVFTPTVQNSADYEIHAIVTKDDGEQVAFDGEFTSDVDATAQEIVEGLQADIAAKTDTALVTATEDDSTLTLTLADSTWEIDVTFSDNLSVSRQDTVAIEVTAVDTGAGTITVQADIAVTAGDLVVSNRDGEYKITTKTVNTEEHTYTPGNVLVPTRARGRVREANIRGLTPTARAELAGLITFDSRVF